MCVIYCGYLEINKIMIQFLQSLQFNRLDIMVEGSYVCIFMQIK